MFAQLGESLTGANLFPARELRYLLEDETDRLKGSHEGRQLSPAGSIGQARGRTTWCAGKRGPAGSFASW